MNIYLYELKMYKRSALIWAASIFVMIIWFLAIYPAIGSDPNMMNMILENYPEDMLKAFGMNTGLPLSSVLGYYAFTFPFIQLCLAMQSANYGVSMLSIEERELTADFLMSKPISRRKIIVSKFFAVLTALTITQIGIWLATFIGLELFKDGNEYDVSYLMILLSTILLFQLFFVAIGMLLSVTSKKIRSVISYSMGLSFGLYTLNALKNILGGDTLGLISPFYYYEPGYILENGSFDMPFYLIGIVVITIALGLSYILYLRRNIHSV